MGQLVQLCAAPNEYIALALLSALRLADVPCVQLTNEIPQRPGFNFGLGPYAYLLIDAADEPRAREVLDEVRGTICGEEHDCEWIYPSVINIRSYRGLVLILLLCGAVIDVGLPVGAFLNHADLSANAPTGAMIGLTIVGAVPTLLWAGFIAILVYANWPLCKRTAAALGIGFLTLLVLPFWLIFLLLFEYVPWLVRLPQRLSRPPGGTPR
jgi:hypothetical protein